MNISTYLLYNGWLPFARFDYHKVTTYFLWSSILINIFNIFACQDARFCMFLLVDVPIISKLLGQNPQFNGSVLDSRQLAVGSLW
jgi:hypothetical protein